MEAVVTGLLGIGFGNGAAREGLYVMRGHSEK